MQLGGDAGAVGVILGGGETFAKRGDLVLTSSAPANFWAAAGCGHEGLLSAN